MKNITDTGVRGYLKWLQADQPVIYAAVAPTIAQQFPGAFSDYEQSMFQGSLMGFADDTTDTSSDFYVGITPYTSTNPLTTYTPDTSSAATAATTGPDVASAANSGPVSPDIISGIASVVSAAGQVYLTSQQVSAYNAINQAQLTRAATGTISPLQISSTKLGIPLITGGGTATLAAGGGLLAVVGLGLLALMMMRKRG
jgi:hypothetical protein